MRRIFGQIVLCPPFWLLFYFSFIFPCAAVKRTWALAGITERAYEKFIIETFSPGLHRQTLRRRKLWMTHVLKYYLQWTASQEENFIGWEVYLSWNMWEFYESGGLLQCYGSSNFLTFRSILPSNKAERCIQKNKSMRCDKLDEKSFLFSPWTPIYFVANENFCANREVYWEYCGDDFWV